MSIQNQADPSVNAYCVVERLVEEKANVAVFVLHEITITICLSYVFHVDPIIDYSIGYGTTGKYERSTPVFKIP